jgi:hypothetical protein
VTLQSKEKDSWTCQQRVKEVESVTKMGERRVTFASRDEWLNGEGDVSNANFQPSFQFGGAFKMVISSNTQTAPSPWCYRCQETKGTRFTRAAGTGTCGLTPTTILSLELSHPLILQGASSRKARGGHAAALFVSGFSDLVFSGAEICCQVL